MRRLIETHLGAVLLAACALGALFPYGGAIPKQTVLALLMATTFLACFRLTVALPLGAYRQALLFCLGRYALLPLAVWGGIQVLLPDYALAALLLALLPSGVSSPAFAQLFDGNVALAFAVTLISSLMAIALIPLYIGMIAHQSVAVDAGALFMTLAACLVLPLAAYLPLKRREPLRRFSREYGKSASILLVAAIIFVVISHQRAVILADPAALLLPGLLAFICYALFGLAGVRAAPSYPDRIAYTACSLFNNAALGVSLGLLYFDERVILTGVAAEIVWAVTPMMMRRLAVWAAP